MDASEKIKYFSSYEDLLDEVQRDMSDRSPLRSRYAVRFVMLNNFDVFTRFAKEITSSGAVEVMNIEDLLPDDNKDAWITGDELKKAIRSCKKSTLITPFSELVRFYKDVDFRGFFNEIILSEDIDNPEKRIYIPLIGLQNRFENFLNGFSRIEESAPVWAYYVEEHRTEVYLSRFAADKNAFARKGNICSLNTLYDWLRFWKSQAPQTQIICASGSIRRRRKYSDPDNIFTFKEIETAHEYIESFLNVTIPFPYEQEDCAFWDKLLEDVLATGPSTFNYRAFILHKLNVQEITPNIIIDKWSHEFTDEYERWLIKNYVLASDNFDAHPYFKLCISETKDYKSQCELATAIAVRIFYFSEASTQSKYAAERRALIKGASEQMRCWITGPLLSYIKERISEIDQADTSLAISLCTGVFDFEKVLAADWFAHRNINGFDIDNLKELCPSLAMYFSSRPYTTNPYPQWQAEYLSAYREAKLRDEITEDIKGLLQAINKDGDSFYKWYHATDESHERLAQFKMCGQPQIDHYFWIDALGAEFLPFISELFREGFNGFKIVHSEITRCNIPSSTFHNKFDITKYQMLDDIAHDKCGYKKYITLLSELETIKEIFNNITISHYHPECTIAIVSDHGLSSLSRKADSKKYSDKAEHEGRYIKIEATGSLHHDADYVEHINESDGERYQVALTHSSLGRKPVHEVHGGCMPEEVLVPLIVISNRAQATPKYAFKLLSKELEISDLQININIMPQPDSVTLTVEGKMYTMTRKGSVWTAKATELADGEHDIMVRTSDGAQHIDKIKVNGTGFNDNFLDF